jgi:cytoskeletal protein CcmA (bactofilin family)
MGSDVMAMVTWGGDANLDGKINIDDYGRIDGNVASSGSVFGWFNGDFNYDGKINIDDYGIIDGNINRQAGAFATADAVAADVVAVPEPSMVAVTALALLMRRRRSPACDRLRRAG